MKNKGFTLFIAITLMGALLLIATGIVSLAVRQALISSSSRESQNAFYAADTGIECALYWDIRNPAGISAFSPSTGSQINCNDQTLTVGGNLQSTFEFNFSPDPYCTIVTITKTPEEWTFCANEGSFCSFPGTKEVRYGANGSYKYLTFTNGTNCTNAVFGDPVPGVAKQCHYRDINSTKIESRGYNSCNPLNPRRVERGIRVVYYGVASSDTTNIPPVANAGSDRSITLPTSSVGPLSGTSATDADGSVASIIWSFVSGPGPTPTISNSSTLTPSLSGLTSAGTYTFRLTATDNLGATGYDDMSVVVSNANIPPVANAGSDGSITLPTTSFGPLSGTSATDADGVVTSTLWSFVSGPGPTPTITSGTTLSPTFSGMTSAGTYTFRLTATDNLGATDSDDMEVVVSTALISLDSISDIMSKTGSPIVSPVTWSHTVGSGSNKIIIVTIASKNGTTPSAVSYAGLALTKVRGDTHGSAFSSIWYRVNPPTGTANVSVTVSNATDFLGKSISLFGVNQSAPVDAHKGGSTSTGWVQPAVSITTNVANTWIIDALALKVTIGESISMNAMTNRVVITNILTRSSGIRLGASRVSPATSAGAYNMTWTVACTDTCPFMSWGMSVAAFKP